MNTEKINELEQKAIRMYIEYCDWGEVIAMLSDDEQEEYYALIGGEQE